jgi:hypothetical protein
MSICNSLRRLAILVVVCTATGCAPPAAVAGRSTATLTAPGIAALQAKEALRYLDIIRDAAQDAEAAHLMPLADAEVVVRWHRALALTLDRAPDWRTAALTGLDQLGTLLSARAQRLLDPYLVAARRIYQAVQA